MARSFLIALLSVVAVAGPASAQIPGPTPLGEDPFNDPAEAIEDAVCRLLMCVAAASDGCDYYEVTLDRNNWPGFQVKVDPDYCVRGFIDDTLGWPPTEGPQLPAIDASEPTPSPDPAPVESDSA